MIKSKTATSGFYCQECGYGFRTIKAAERASFGESGCPKCGGSDIDLGAPVPLGVNNPDGSPSELS